MYSDVEYRTIFENTGTATVIMEEDMTLGLVNGEFERLSGYSRTEIEGIKKLGTFIVEGDMARMSAYHYARRRNPSSAPRNYECRFIDRAGIVKNIYMTVALIPDTLRSVGSFLDITEHKQALHALRESEQRFRSLVENSHTGVFIIQADEIVYKNPEQERLFGPPPQGSKITNIENIHPDDLEKVKNFHQHIRSSDFQTLDIQYRFYSHKHHPNPRLHWVHCRASLIEYMGRKATLVNMMDITKTRELENLLQIKDKMVSLGHVAAGIAHEIRNPLSGINVFLDAIRENYQDPDSAGDIVELVDQAKSATGKIESVIKRVLDFVRPGPPRLQVADINGPINDALLLANTSMRKAGVTVEMRLARDLPCCTIDVQLIEQLILNLVNNAFEAIMEAAVGKKRIIVGSHAEGDAVVISVADSGPGIPPADRRKIFDPFFTTKQEGSGIGLSICQRIITEHRGTISVAEAEIGGAEITIRIPLSPEVQPV